VRELCIALVLATDMSNHFVYMDRYNSQQFCDVKRERENGMTLSKEEKTIVLQMILKGKIRASRFSYTIYSRGLGTPSKISPSTQALVSSNIRRDAKRTGKHRRVNIYLNVF